ncbi:MAG TPA: class I SAM-dependent methyltransferase [Alphaproteobacteria bacterium]|nr:class I SAM-dependent methyltransferase [Alphaproteobacteria bacterium]
MSRSNSSIATTGFVSRLGYIAGLARMTAGRLWREPEIDTVRARIAEYRETLLRRAGKRLEDCRVLEIGFGQRPWTLLWLANLGVDVVGVDLDRPVLRGSPAEFLASARANGTLRALKSFVRFHLLDRRERQAMTRAIAADAGRPFRLPLERLRLDDAGTDAFWDRLAPLDFVYSEDVFEHVPADGLERIVAGMARRLKPDGLAFIRPDVFTGITGGHRLEWYPYTIDRPRARRTEPWEHLRQDRNPADTYLNRLSRKDYRRLFGRHFEILEERELTPDLGRRFLTPEVRAELAAYDEEELFSNQLLFLLRPKAPETGGARP